ncbi:MAG TPA: ribosome-associated translation inhibitor RaiA [Candidatus Dormibacteraeota bacterium]|nr:ribosome-associated translation inhibitor RaiA [Candidatus Dormibacteraeota bacterium]
MLKIQVNGVHNVVGEDILKYVTKKITKLEKYIPKHARFSAHAEVFLKEFDTRGKKQCTCEVVMHLPNDVFAIEETTINIYAAVDIVETKLKNQLRRYKQKNSKKSKTTRLIRAFKRKP